MAIDLDISSTSKRIYLCRNHYKEWEKSQQKEILEKRKEGPDGSKN